MSIYLLSRRADTGYDEFDGKIVRAASEEEARSIANINTGDEGRVWTLKEHVTCEEVPLDGESKVLLASFNAG